jgi:ssDNA-binding Zn-finger/Zn-ribbon topoisomerase 1
MMMITSRLAGLKCPNCGTLQPYTPLIKTRATFFVPNELPKCGKCAGKLWIEEGRGFAQAVVIFIFLLLYLSINNSLISLFLKTLEPSPLADTLETWAGPVMHGFVVGLVIYPLSARVYKVGHSL